MLGDCRAVLPTLEAESVDAVVCDPPYGLSFMGKGWDHGVPGVPFWTEALRVLKPGAHALIFGGDRTHHRLMVAVEDSGFEIRDCLSWLYGSGFPKSLDVSKAIDKAAGAERAVVGEYRMPADSTAPGFAPSQGLGFGSNAEAGRGRPITGPATDAARAWSGFGTALKPAWEPIILARKPLTGTVAANVLKHGTGAINVDGCRIAGVKGTGVWGTSNETTNPSFAHSPGRAEFRSKAVETESGSVGRWPANVVLSHTPECRETGTRSVRRSLIQKDAYSGDDTDGTNTYGRGLSPGSRCVGAVDETVPVFECAPECPVRALDEQSIAGGIHGAGRARSGSSDPRPVNYRGHVPIAPAHDTGEMFRLGDSGGASRFFYTSKASRADREDGLEGQPTQAPRTTYDKSVRDGNGGDAGYRRSNHHPTVKPTDLMRWLCRLVTPPGGLILDPFCGSGSTGVAALAEGFRFIGIEQDAEYVEIAKRRIANVAPLFHEAQP